MNMKKLLSLVMVLTLLVSFGVPTFAADAVEITIFHLNDTHSRIEEDDYAGSMGLAKVSSIVNDARDAGDNVLLLDAGDALHGQTIATLSKGESIIDIMNLMGYDAMTAGNHDFNYGQDRLVELAGMADFPILGANVLKSDDTPLLDEYVIKEFDGVKVGIFGLSTPETLYKTHPDNVAGLTFADPTETAQTMVDTLEPLVDIIVCLGHIGNEGDYTAEGIVSAVDGIDVFVDAHSHTAYETGLKVNDTLIVQAGEYDKNLGKVSLSYENGIVTASASLITKDAAADIVPDEAVTALIDEIKTTNEVITSEVVASTDVELLGERGDVRTGQTNLGNLIAESILDATGADVALTNGGGIRASIDVGDITLGEVITVLPFGNYVVTKEVTGADIKFVLEVGLSKYPDASGAFPHIAGMTFTFDPNKAAGSRLVSVKIGGVEVVDTQTYVLATNDFSAAGGDDFTVLADYPILGEYSALDEVLVDYLNANGTDAAVVDGRITALPIVVPEPEAPATPEEPATIEQYVVVDGDVLWRIARSYGTTWQVLAEYNQLANPNLIYIGDIILIP